MHAFKHKISWKVSITEFLEEEALFSLVKKLRSECRISHDTASMQQRGLRFLAALQRSITQSLKHFYLKLSEVEQAGQLEGSPLVVVDSRAKEVESESGRHGAEQLQAKTKGNINSLF